MVVFTFVQVGFVVFILVLSVLVVGEGLKVAWPGSFFPLNFQKETWLLPPPHAMLGEGADLC